jgi:hypothetical protein
MLRLTSRLLHWSGRVVPHCNLFGRFMSWQVIGALFFPHLVFEEATEDSTNHCNDDNCRTSHTTRNYANFGSARACRSDHRRGRSNCRWAKGGRRRGGRGRRGRDRGSQGWGRRCRRDGRGRICWRCGTVAHTVDEVVIAARPYRAGTGTRAGADDIGIRSNSTRTSVWLAAGAVRAGAAAA